MTLVGLWITNVVVGSFVLAVYSAIKKNKDNQCRHCKYLTRIGSDRAFKYSCTLGDTMSFVHHSFDYPPEFCKYFEQREVKNDED